MMWEEPRALGFLGQCVLVLMVALSAYLCGGAACGVPRMSSLLVRGAVALCDSSRFVLAVLFALFFTLLFPAYTHMEALAIVGPMPPWRFRNGSLPTRPLVPS